MPAAARRDLAASAALASAAAVAATGALVIGLVELGPLSLLMAQHLFVMNVLAPLAALASRKTLPERGSLWLAAFLQLAVLYVWHEPSVQRAAAPSWQLHAIGLVVLAVCSFWFWRLVLCQAARARWPALAALLLTGKLACLLGALLVFAPRDLYRLDGLFLAICSAGPSTLADQHLAGLLMITACPLSYLVAGVVLAAGMLDPDETVGLRKGRSVVTR
ncbi:cytochrome c oxidase assembly protein [Bosea sp. BK604]|uniref:cytochrome c oxidase assembly protein n=1 Tax=Bosea sp. BK604 TaxID=2512180 RepID=UPI0010E912DC|nr:cytochrome c oxidase assembly protein [Bosea sp. BK604]TCR65709.1 putative membrane protein [Bosea sp. BK604]